MSTNVVMPKLSMTMQRATVVKWLREEGDRVDKGEPLVKVMTEKITSEISAPVSGILARIVAPVKTKIPAGDIIAVIAQPDEELPELEVIAPPAAQETPEGTLPEPEEARPRVMASPAARRAAKERDVDLAQVKGTGSSGRITEEDVRRFVDEREKAPSRRRILTSPMARKLAQEHRIDLAEVTGTGTGGRITEKDVRAFVESREEALPPPAAPPARVIPFLGMREAIAERMAHSLRSTAQVTIHTEVDATELVKLREQLTDEFDLTYTDLIIKAAAKALKAHPMLNATLVGDEIHMLEQIHIGMAVALEEGLLVPVVRDADQRSLPEIAEETKRLARGAREETLTVEEVTGGTFTVSNLGAYGAEGFTPIINPPEVAILGVGRIADKPAIHQGQIARRSIMVLSLTIDHRIVDGAPGAQFLRTVQEILESPYRLLI
jgi:pyruvate dehydrogenase E2 component (dihydrolipoamide acetyltransferase)